MDRRRFERRTITGLLILLTIEVSLLALHLMWGGFRPHDHNSATALAGEVSISEHELRKRSLNSLVWEKSATHDSIYYYDSILTLAQSTAKLKLFNDTELKLSENTLVTIEPPTNDKHGEIRLQFHRGGFKARNPYSKTEVKSDSWSMEIKTGSEVDLRQAGNDYELQVMKGEVNFKSAHGDSHVTKDQVLRIDPEAKPTPIQVLPDDALHWVKPPERRIYTHKKEESLTLHWQGQHPTQLVRQTVGGSEETMPLAGDAEQATITLPLGHHSLYLRGEKITSQPLDVEVWTAPIVHLIGPLPRNRVKTVDPVTFVWTWRPEVVNFHFRLKGSTTDIQQSQLENTFTTHFDAEDDAEWRVEGEDKDGFLIPAPYSYPIYIREAPLAAPKLKNPVLRRPAKNDGASFIWRLQEWLLPEAKADEENDYQALFEWEPVERADRYVIEISETSDFRKPIVTETLHKSDYLWKHIPLKTIYWRVAAGNKRGQMGFFSEPQEVNLADVHSENVTVSVIEKPKPKEEEKPVVPPTPPPPAPAPTPPPVKDVAKKEPLKPHYRVEWRPSYVNITSAAANQVDAKLQGVDPVDLAFHGDQPIHDTHILRIDAEYSSVKFKPSPANQYPNQSAISWPDVHLSGIVYQVGSIWGFGGLIETVPIFTRQDLTSIKGKAGFETGPVAENWRKWEHLEYFGSYSALVGSNFGARTSQSLRTPLWEDLVGGITFSAEYFVNTGGSTSSLTGQITFGWQF